MNGRSNILGTNVPHRVNFDIGRREAAHDFGGSGDPSGGDDDFVSVIGYEGKQSVGDKVTNSLAGLFIGPILIIIACTLLWRNESWAIKTHRSLNEALEAHVEIQNPKFPPDETFYNKLVHVTGKVNVDGPITDHQFQLVRKNAIALTRHVEIFQWVETIREERRKLQNGDTEIRERISYSKKWVSGPITKAFRRPHGHENFGDMPMLTETQRAYEVQLGVYILSNTLTNQISERREVPISDIKALPEGASISGNRIDWPIRYRGGGVLEGHRQIALPYGVEARVMRIDGAERTMYAVKATGDTFSSKERAIEVASKDRAVSAASYFSQPEIGDIRIYFTEVPCVYVSILAQLSASGNMLTNWSSKQGGGYDVALLKQGAVTARDMIQSEQEANRYRTWCFRGGGWLLSVVGFSMVTSIISTTADITLNWIPLLGPMSTSLIGLGLAVANGVMALCLTLLVSSVAWLFYRPALSASMLIGSLGIFFAASKAGGEAAAMGKTFKEM